MKLKFCGAAGTTIGSQHLLEVNGKRILLDCGLYQGSRKDAFEAQSLQQALSVRHGRPVEIAKLGEEVEF